MSDFSLELNEDQLQIVKWVHEFAENVVRPAGPEWDEREETPWPIIQEAAKNGLYSFDFIAQCFSDPTGLLMCLVNEEMSWGDAGIALAIFGSTLAVAGIFANGTPEQIGEWIPQCFGTPDDVKLAAFGVSEPDAGSDVSSLKSRAVYDEAKDEWVLNGTKTWITNGGIANTHVLVLSVDPSLGQPRPGAASSCPRERRASRRARSSRRWASGPRTRPRSSSRTAGCRGAACSAARRSSTSVWPGPRRGRRRPRRRPWPPSRRPAPLWARRPSGIARAAYEYSLDYAKERKQFGRAIIENQAIAFKLADMKMHTDAARLLVHRAANMASTGKKFENGEGSMSKLYAGENAVWVTDQAIQILGGYGYVRENPVEQWHRDSKIYTIFEGTSEIQRLVISPGHLGHPHQLTREIRWSDRLACRLPEAPRSSEVRQIRSIEPKSPSGLLRKLSSDFVERPDQKFRSLSRSRKTLAKARPSVSAPSNATTRVFPLGLSAAGLGAPPTWIVPTVDPVDVSIADMEPEPSLTTRAFFPLGARMMDSGFLPTFAVARTTLEGTAMRETVPD